MAKEIICTDKAPAAIGPYVQAVKSNGILFISGQLGFDMKDGSIPGGSGGSGCQFSEKSGDHYERGGHRQDESNQDHDLSDGHGRFRQSQRSIRKFFLKETIPPVPAWR